MTVGELIIELGKCPDQNRRVIFYHSDGKDYEVAFNVVGRIRDDVKEVDWIRVSAMANNEEIEIFGLE